MAKKKRKNRGDENEEESGEKGGGKGKLLVAVVLVVAGVVAWRFVLSPTPADSVESEGATEEQEEAVVEEGLIFPMEEIVVNLADETESRYLRIGLALVLEEGLVVDDIAPEAPRAIDAAIDYLSDRTFDELRAPGSKTEVRDELSTRIRAAFGDEMVLRVLLTTFVMQ